MFNAAVAARFAGLAIPMWLFCSLARALSTSHCVADAAARVVEKVKCMWSLLVWSASMWTDFSGDVAYGRFIAEPLMALYRHAPSVGGVGGWSGFTQEQICARLNGQSESFWAHHSLECQDLVEGRLRSLAITVQTVIYFFGMFRCLYWIMTNGVHTVGFVLHSCWSGKSTSGACSETQSQLSVPHAVVYYREGRGQRWNPGTSGGYPEPPIFNKFPSDT